jgi:hypothetical protein
MITKATYLAADLVLSVLRTTVTDVILPTTDVDKDGKHVVPGELRQWLARLRMLEGVPFAHLAADSALLPSESIRFFYLDRRWTDALVQGALGVGTASSVDRAQLEQLYGPIRAEVDDAERTVRPVGGEGVTSTSDTITGFLLRSSAVSGWPGLHVRAYDRELAEGDNAIVPESDARRLRLLRLERLAPAVLLALFDGVPAIVHVEEPRRGVQFGVRLDPGGETATSFAPWIPQRNPLDPQQVVDPRVDVACRPGSPGVLDLRHLGRTLGATDSAQFALQLLRFPYRQVFGDTDHPVDQLPEVFRPTVSIVAAANQKTIPLVARFEEGLA